MYNFKLILLSFASILFISIKVVCGTDESLIDSSFRKYGVVYDAIPKAPSSVAMVKYRSGVFANLGNILTPTLVKDEPTVTWNSCPDDLYTLVMFDPDVPSRQNPTLAQLVHWLVGNIPGQNVGCGQTLAEYIGAGPPLGTGLHRYIFLVYKQPDGEIDFDEPYIPNTESEPRKYFSVYEFASKYNFGDPIAGNVFRAEYDDYVPILQEQING